MLGEGEATSIMVNVEQEPRIVSGLQERVLRKSGDTGISVINPIYVGLIFFFFNGRRRTGGDIR